MSALPGTALADGLAHPGYAAAVGGALTAALAGRAITALRARKQLTWAVDLDMPVGLAPGRSPATDWTMIFAEHGYTLVHPDPAEGWLVLVTVTNTGLMPLRGRDFPGPSAFRFPGREVCDARICPDPASLRSGRRPPLLAATIDPPGRRRAAGSNRAPGVTLGSELLLRPGDAFTLMAVLRGTPARALPPVSLEGTLSNGAIVTTRPGGPSFSWGKACATTAALLALILCGLLLGAAT
jgi:hypothetical protein